MSSSPLHALPKKTASIDSASSSNPPTQSDSSSSAPCSSSTPLPLLDLWRHFRSCDPRFACKFVAYHFYRSRGWVPRCGLKFGVDFLLYVFGPKDYHATFSLVVEEVDHRLRMVSWLRIVIFVCLCRESCVYHTTLSCC